MRAALRKLFPVDAGEWRPVLIATAYGFAILFSYYILRPVRDEISTVDRGNLQILWTAVFFVMLVAVPAYSSLVSRFSRGVFIPFANRFFALNILAFWAALVFLPESARPWIDRVFYVWVSMFALFVVTVFWGFVADLFRNEQGKRLFGFIAVGSSLGGIAGSGLTAALAETIPVFTLLLISVVPLEVAAQLARALHRASGRDDAPLRKETGKVRGTAWSGIRVLARNPYLRHIAAFLALMTFASTILYFQQAHLVGEAFEGDRPGSRAFLARIDFWVNVITILTQGLFTAAIIRKIGVGLALASIPVVTFLGFLSLGIYPLLWVLVAVQVIYRSGRYAISKPAREILFTVVGREERYKSKAFIDAAVYRGGDLVSGWIYAGLSFIGLSVGAIALVAAPMAAVWAGVGFLLGRRQEELAGQTDDPAPAATASASA